METKKINTAKRIRALISKGYNNKDIIDKLQCRPQAVYTVRYQVNKQRGLGSIGEGVAAPVDGIGTPPKRKYVRKVRAGKTNIVPETEWQPPLLLSVPEPQMRITLIEPEPWWKVRVKNLARALGWRG
jgi:hypothetical protein